MSPARSHVILLAGLAVFSAACHDISTATIDVNRSPRLLARPNPYITASLDTGIHRITEGRTQFVVYVPERALKKPVMPLDLLLHASYRNVEQLVQEHRAYADSDGVVVVAPYAAIDTWDAIYETFGRDLLTVDHSLAWVFDRLPIDRNRIVISGFSDGATYALALGRANGDLFERVVAYSPGFLIDVETVGSPEIAISHGTHDEELPYENTRDKIVPALQHAGYDVEFHTFEGKHEVLLSLVKEVLDDLAYAP